MSRGRRASSPGTIHLIAQRMCCTWHKPSDAQQSCQWRIQHGMDAVPAICQQKALLRSCAVHGRHVSLAGSFWISCQQVATSLANVNPELTDMSMFAEQTEGSQPCNPGCIMSLATLEYDGARTWADAAADLQDHELVGGPVLLQHPLQHRPLGLIKLSLIPETSQACLTPT